MKTVLLRGMHGLGDNVHQRAVIRALKKHTGARVAVETPWPELSADLADEIYLPEKSLRTQTKNVSRHAGVLPVLHAGDLSKFSQVLKNWYTAENVRRFGYVGAMLHGLGLPRTEQDFSFNPQAGFFVLGNTERKPVMVYRPLTVRTEWSGCENRNPDAEAYHDLFAALREHFFVVSVADLAPNVEWITSKPVKADLEAHTGGLSSQNLFWLYAKADLVFCAPGFSLPLAQSVGTKVICVYGGRENSKFYAQNERTLGVDTVQPCSCMTHTHPCNKRIDVAAWLPRVKAFAGIA